MARKQKIKVLSVTYQVGNKTFTASSEETFEGNLIQKGNFLITEQEKIEPLGISSDFKCINGVMHMNVCVGGVCHWVSLKKPCK